MSSNGRTICEPKQGSRCLATADRLLLRAHAPRKPETKEKEKGLSHRANIGPVYAAAPPKLGEIVTRMRWSPWRGVPDKNPGVTYNDASESVNS